MKKPAPCGKHPKSQPMCEKCCHHVKIGGVWCYYCENKLPIKTRAEERLIRAALRKTDNIWRGDPLYLAARAVERERQRNSSKRTP